MRKTRQYGDDAKPFSFLCNFMTFCENKTNKSIEMYSDDWNDATNDDDDDGDDGDDDVIH